MELTTTVTGEAQVVERDATQSAVDVGAASEGSPRAVAATDRDEHLEDGRS